MKKNFKLFLLTIISISAISCRKEIKSEKGGIDVISNVYFKASEGLDKMQSFHISKMSYVNDSIFEFVPDNTFPDVNSATYFIKDSVYYDLGTNDHPIVVNSSTQKALSVYNKKNGAIFSNDDIPNYRNRKNLEDTILFNKNFKRFEINSPWMYTRFYVYPTDTILPYSMYKKAEQDYSGRIERIDSYNKKTDVFVSLQIIPRKELNQEATDILEYSKFINKTQKSKK